MLVKKQWIAIYSEDTDSRKKKEYLITRAGTEAFQAEKARLEKLLRNAALMDENQS